MPLSALTAPPIPAPEVPGANLPVSDGAKAPIAAEPKLNSFDFRPELVPSIGLAKRLFDPHVIKRDFPILQERINGRQLVWLDNAATTQKPKAVIDALPLFTSTKTPTSIVRRIPSRRVQPMRTRVRARKCDVFSTLVPRVKLFLFAVRPKPLT